MSATVEKLNEAIRRTCEAREQVLNSGADAIISALAQTARNWLEPGNPWRRRAVEQAPASTGFSPQMVNEAVTLTFGALTEDAFETLLRKEVGERRQFQGPRLIAHFLAGNVPAPGINSICFGLLLKSANIVKLSARDPVFPALFVEALREVDAELADCVTVLDWRREKTELTRAALSGADVVIAYGDDETIGTIRRMCGPRARFLGYGHKLSFAVIGKEVMTADNLSSLAEAAAFDASVYDQQGCLSPHVFYVEEGGELSPRAFAEALAKAMAAYAERVPRGRLSIEEAAHIAKLRGAYEFRAASDKSVAVWAGAGTATDPTNPLHASRRGEAAAPYQRLGRAGWLSPPSANVYEMASASWLVIYEEDAMFTPSCLNRVVFVKPVEQLECIPELVHRYASSLSTVGIAPMAERTNTFAVELAKLGVNRVCPIGQMQRPPLWWYHDGRPNIADLVRWTDVE